MQKYGCYNEGCQRGNGYRSTRGTHQSGSKTSCDNPKESKEGKPRPITIKSARYDVRNTLHKNGKKLKGKSFLITENLTAARLALLKEAQEKCGVRNVWATNGRILLK